MLKEIEPPFIPKQENLITENYINSKEKENIKLLTYL